MRASNTLDAYARWVGLAGVGVIASVMAVGSAHSVAAGVVEQPITVRLTDLDGSSVLLTEAEQALARQWSLTDADWVKYKELMQGPRGLWSPGLDPITALGVSETDPKERSRYADIWMRVESRRMELELAFEVERMAAANRILGDMPVVDDARFRQNFQYEQEQKQKRYQVLMFADSSCLNETCKMIFNDVYGSLGKNTGTSMDVYFIAGTTSEQIGSWASAHGISPEEVRGRRVTLNFDDGTFASYGVSSEALPRVVVLDRETGSVTSSVEGP